MRQFQTADGISYVVDDFGTVHQVNPQAYEYDKEYISTYAKPEYREASRRLSAMRYGFVCGAAGYPPQRLLDYGYGDGSFLSWAVQDKRIHAAMGYDITGLPVPEGCLQVTAEGRHNHKWDAVTFWDVLEHVPNPDKVISELNADLIVISLPHCHFGMTMEKAGFDVALEWFDNWKHRKPHEHIHHYSMTSIAIWMESLGYRWEGANNMEDIVRTPVDGYRNILTTIFRRLP